METTKNQSQADKYIRRGRLFKLILGWFNIALALYLSGYSIYSLIIGKTDQLPQIAACLPAGIVLARSMHDGNMKSPPNNLLHD